VYPEPEFVNLLRSPGIDPSLRLAESFPWNRFLGSLNLKIRAQSSLFAESRFQINSGFLQLKNEPTTVELIYFLYYNYKKKSVLGNPEWSPSSRRNIQPSEENLQLF
jgi:hypothetical protein